MDFQLPTRIKGYNGYLLIKFTSCLDHQNDFLDGKLFFNTTDFFAQCETKGRKDWNEGQTIVYNYKNPNLTALDLEIVDGKMAIIPKDYSKNPSEYKTGTVINYSSEINRRRKIICFYTAYVNADKNSISPVPKNIGNEFGEYGVLILNRQIFFDRIIVALEKRPDLQEKMIGFVQYEKMDAGINMWHPFRKNIDEFEYQHEFRIAFVSQDEKPLKFDIGCSLRDIAVPIMADDVDKIRINNNYIYYPKY